MREFKVGDVLRNKGNGRLCLFLSGLKWAAGDNAIVEKDYKRVGVQLRSGDPRVVHGFSPEDYDVVFNLFEEFENDRNS
jgi:hypothetical protein